MKLDKAFEGAVISAWQDLMKVASPCSVRVEYECEPGATLDYLSVWAAKAEGYQNLVCDYWTWTSSAHASGVRFTNGYHSDGLGQTLDFIMKNQEPDVVKDIENYWKSEIKDANSLASSPLAGVGLDG